MAPPAVAKKPRAARADDGASFGPIAERFRRAGELDRAVLVCREGLKRFPHHISARATLGWALLDLGQYEEARAELEQVLRRAPDNLAAIRGLAELHDRAEHTLHLPMDGPGQWPPPPDSAELADAESLAATQADDAMVFTSDDSGAVEPAVHASSVMAPPEMGIPIWTPAADVTAAEPAAQPGVGMSSVRELDPAADFASVGDPDPAPEQAFEPEVIYQPAATAPAEPIAEPEPILHAEAAEIAPDVDLAALITDVATVETTEAHADVDLDLAQPAVVLDDGDIDLSLFDAPGTQDASKAPPEWREPAIDDAAGQPDVDLDLSADGDLVAEVDLVAVDEAVEAVAVEVSAERAEAAAAESVTEDQPEADVFELVAPTLEWFDSQAGRVDLESALEAEPAHYEHTGPDLLDVLAAEPDEPAEIPEADAHVEMEVSADVGAVEAVPEPVVEPEPEQALDSVAVAPAAAVVVTGFAGAVIEAAATAAIVPMVRPEARGQAELNQARIAALERFLVKVQARRRRLMAESVA